MKYRWFEKGAYASSDARKYLASEFDPKKVKKVAVIRHAALGDLVIVRPFIIETRKFFPNAEITLVGVTNYQYGLPSDLADSTYITFGKDVKSKHSFSEKLKNIKGLGEQDIIFDLSCTNRTHWLTALNKAKLKFGFPYKPMLNGTIYNVSVLRSDFQHEIDCMLDMLRFLGHVPAHVPDFGYPDNRCFRPQSEQNFVYFNGASTESKILPAEQMYQLMKEASEAFPNIKHCYLEGVHDREKGGFLSSLVEEKDNVEIIATKPLEELTEYIARSTMIIAPDTGIRNLAVSTHTPTVGIFYSTVPFRYTPKYESGHKIVMNADSSIPTNSQIVDAMRENLETLA
ncbi:lipopolysaccharide heptosyltransferase family protein [Enterovibrio sp. ZSDZ35]|uniref:Lipopolysaccharide heptosyltransferase family protein n=1 Tax=Enterovibrio qingdaonensis TaxID=2899818 RepID=A0ABT5QM48_9GAMM|nr:glycosyltransferase family 9 protein [Enterovibrio sp. ZSDZ35]MDD1782062.1 lipopolysaccharide heptosyltransferase family protein [Enterovibrio sp. ZSDZ35]